MNLHPCLIPRRHQHSSHMSAGHSVICLAHCASVTTTERGGGRFRAQRRELGQLPKKMLCFLQYSPNNLVKRAERKVLTEQLVEHPAQEVSWPAQGFVEPWTSADFPCCMCDVHDRRKKHKVASPWHRRCNALLGPLLMMCVFITQGLRVSCRSSHSPTLPQRLPQTLRSW